MWILLDLIPSWLPACISIKILGVRLIGVGATSRHIISKSILFVIGSDIQDAAGASQLCARQKAGGEAAVHAMQKVFLEDAVLEIDATNAFA